MATDSGRNVVPGEPPPLIAHIIFRLDVGGLENGLVNLINAMPAGAYRHVIICLKDYSDFRLRITRPDVRVYALNKQDGKDPAFYIRLWRLLRRLRPDIVHTRNLTTLDCAVLAALTGARRRVHGEHGWDMIDLTGASRKYNLLRRVCRPFVNHYITVSRDLAGWLQSSAGVPPSHFTQIYNGVDTVKFYPAKGGREGLPDAGFAPSHAIVIGTVGRMQQVKDPLNLVRAFIHLLDSVPHARNFLRLIMIGDGSLRNEAQALLMQAEADGLAWLPGARNDIPQLMRGMDIFVLPSLNEGISNTILEAMACALPVIATDVGGNPELVTPATGFLVPASNSLSIADAVRQYIFTPDLLQKHGKAARARVDAEFSLDAMVKSYQTVYDRIIQSV